MKAVICTKYGAPEVLQFREVEKPVPKDNEVLIKIHATTVTVADYRIRSFTVPPSFWLPARIALGITKPRKPILGVELAGEIESVGKDVTLFRKGDPVFAATLKDFGAYAEYKCLPENGAICLKPSGLTFEEAAAIPIGARTALHFLKKGDIQRGQKILIYGASGSVGTYAVQLARHFGAEVTGVSSRLNLELVKAQGADKVIAYDDEDFLKKLELYDIIFMAVDKWPFQACKKFLKNGGTYMNITEPLKSPSMLWSSITSKKKIRIIVGEDPAENAEGMRQLKELAETGTIKPVMDRSYPLEKIVEAHHYVGQGHKKGNVAITVFEKENFI